MCVCLLCDSRFKMGIITSTWSGKKDALVDCEIHKLIENTKSAEVTKGLHSKSFLVNFLFSSQKFISHRHNVINDASQVWLGY